MGQIALRTEFLMASLAITCSAPLSSFQIVLWGRTEKCLKETTEEIRQMGTECHYFICDVGNREEVYQTAKAVREKVSSLGGAGLSSVGILAKGDSLTGLGRELCLWWNGCLQGTSEDSPVKLVQVVCVCVCVCVCVLQRAGTRDID